MILHASSLGKDPRTACWSPSATTLRALFSCTQLRALALESTDFSLGMLLPADIGAELDGKLFKGNARSLAEELARRRINLRRWHSHAYTW